MGFLDELKESWTAPFEQLSHSTVKVFTNPLKANIGDYFSALNPLGSYVTDLVKNPSHFAYQAGTVGAGLGIFYGAPYAASALGTGLTAAGTGLTALGKAAPAVGLAATLQNLGQKTAQLVKDFGGGAQNALSQLIPSNIFQGANGLNLDTLKGFDFGKLDLPNLKLPNLKSPQSVSDFVKNIPAEVQKILPPGGASIGGGEISNVATPKISAPPIVSGGDFGITVPVIALGAGAVLLFFILRKT